MVERTEQGEPAISSCRVVQILDPRMRMPSQYTRGRQCQIISRPAIFLDTDLGSGESGSPTASKRKMAVVAELLRLRGEDLEGVSRKDVVTATALSASRDAF